MYIFSHNVRKKQTDLASFSFCAEPRITRQHHSARDCNAGNAPCMANSLSPSFSMVSIHGTHCLCNRDQIYTTCQTLVIQTGSAPGACSEACTQPRIRVTSDAPRPARRPWDNRHMRSGKVRVRDLRPQKALAADSKRCHVCATVHAHAQLAVHVSRATRETRAQLTSAASTPSQMLPRRQARASAAQSAAPGRTGTCGPPRPYACTHTQQAARSRPAAR